MFDYDLFKKYLKDLIDFSDEIKKDKPLIYQMMDGYCYRFSLIEMKPENEEERKMIELSKKAKYVYKISMLTENLEYLNDTVFVFSENNNTYELRGNENFIVVKNIESEINGLKEKLKRI